MASKIAAITNHLIGLLLMSYVLYFFIKQNKENPGKKFSGLSFKQIRIIVLTGIAIDILLIAGVLSGLTNPPKSTYKEKPIETIQFKILGKL